MLVPLNKIQFAAVLAERGDMIQARKKFTFPLYMSICQQWLPTIGENIGILLTFIVGRTVERGYGVAKIPFTEFQKGYVDQQGEIKPVSFGETTLRKCLTQLTNDDFLTVYCLKNSGEIDDSAGRIIEINLKLAISPYVLKLMGGSFFGEMEQLIYAEKVAKGTPQILRGHPSDFEGSLYIDSIGIRNTNILNTNNEVSARFAAPSSIVENLKTDTVTGGYILKSISIPKRPRPAVRRNDSIAEVLTTVKSKRVEISATRIAGIAANGITAKGLQALLDKAMQDYYPASPRLIVTAKPFGVLRKRLESGTVQSIPHFVEFSIREWSLIASRNRASFLRNPSKTTNSAPLSQNPTFNEFAYRLPYFLAVYAQSLSAPESKASSEDERIAKLQAKLEAAEQANQNNREVIRRIRRATPTGTVTGRYRSADPAAGRSNTPKAGHTAASNIEEFSNLLDNWAPPAWDNPTDNATNKTETKAVNKPRSYRGR